MAVEVEFLKSMAYFPGLGLAELERLKKYLFEKAVAGGEVILFEGESAKTLYFVVSGVVKVFKTSAEGKEQILYLVRPGESVNDIPVFGDGPNLASASAIRSVLLYGIDKGDLRIVLRDYPPLVLNLIRVLSQRIEHLVSVIEDLSFRHVTSRVARILLEYAADGASHRPRLTQQEMAAMAGTAREMVGRSLKVLQEEGIVRVERHRIVIKNKAALKEIAEAVS